MGAGYNQISDLFDIYNQVQHSFIRYPKDVIIFTLRDIFSKDSYYKYTKDDWGYPKTTDHTDQDPKAGMFDDGTTRVYIGEAFRYDVQHYPSITVKHGGARYVPISLNRNKEFIHYKRVRYIDSEDETNEMFVQLPDKFVLSGAWEGSIIIEVTAKGLRAREDLIEIVSAAFVDWVWQDMYRVGISVKPSSPTISSPSEAEDRNDKFYRQSVTLEIRTEWHREIPITSFVDAINFCIDFANLEANPPVVSPNLTINTKVEFLDGFEMAT